MRKYVLFTILAVVLCFPSLSYSEGADPCSAKYTALSEVSLVGFSGTGDMDVTVITDPLCWHCRLGHKLLGEYPELYGTVKIVFFPRKSFVGSDMAAWILEDAAASDQLKAMIDYAYEDLKQPKTEDLMEARMLVLQQFVETFPSMLEDTTMPELYVRLQKEREAHVLEGAVLANDAEMPGTPVLIAGQQMVVGYGPSAWLKALEKKEICE